MILGHIVGFSTFVDLGDNFISLEISNGLILIVSYMLKGDVSGIN